MANPLLWGVLMLASGSIWAQTATALNRNPHSGAAAKLQVRPQFVRNAPLAPIPSVPDALSAEQLVIAEKVAVGKIPCELPHHVTIAADERTAGRFVLEAGREKHLMDPVATSTGAVRLEDAKTGAVWLQLANKSMLMNQKLGKRLADGCMNPEQIRVAEDMARLETPGLLDPLPAEVVPAAVASAIN